MNSVADNNEKSSAAANASLDDYKANLTAAQKQVIWQNLSSVKTMRANERNSSLHKLELPFQTKSPFSHCRTR